ncbi:MAG: GNAT family N-acetyltransferase [Pseudomonadota bacterium]
MIEVRPFASEDTEAFLRLYRDCVAHYGSPAQPASVEKVILQELLADHGLTADIAWNGTEAVGFTCSARVFPAGDGFALYLKELYVTADARGTGAGRALMRNLAERAMALGYNSLRWESKEADALQFYARLGAPDNGKTSFTVGAEALKGFAAS